MASRGLCSFGELDVWSDSARLAFAEAPTVPDVDGAARPGATLRPAPSTESDLDELDV
ncbi:MAG: hypothetical protein JWP87_3868 [Labilithrix sp.]|jgi:hypothetical protein|nr:hypothetical protein [Labilithrix sp.]